MEKITEIVPVNFKLLKVSKAKVPPSSEGRPQRKSEYDRKKIVVEIQRLYN